MQYIKIDSDGIVHWDNYFNYIESISNKLPLHIYEYAKDFKHYSLSDKESLHDAWLDKFALCENRTSKEALLILDFLGSHHDRVLKFSYESIISYEIKGCLSDSFISPHGDVFIHEIREKDGAIEHEILFSTKSKIIVTCKNILFNSMKL